MELSVSLLAKNLSLRRVLHELHGAIQLSEQLVRLCVQNRWGTEYAEKHYFKNSSPPGHANKHLVCKRLRGCDTAVAFNVRAASPGRVCDEASTLQFAV